MYNVAPLLVVDWDAGVALVPDFRDGFEIEDGSELEHVAVLDPGHDVLHALLFVFQSTCHDVHLFLLQVMVGICHLFTKKYSEFGGPFSNSS